MNELILSERMPVLPLRGLTVFPQTTTHFDVGREKSVRALDKAMSGDQRIYLATQKDILRDDPSFDDLYPIGTVVQIRQVLKMPGCGRVPRTRDRGAADRPLLLRARRVRPRCGLSSRYAED